MRVGTTVLLTLVGAWPGAATARNACRLLTGEEVKAITPTVVLANVMVDEPTHSECQWEDADGRVLLRVKAHWSGGRQQWETWQRAKEVAKPPSGPPGGAGDVVEKGFVSGLGDAAYFDPGGPSLLLKGDVLVELSMRGAKEPGRSFRPSATSLLGRI